MILDQKLRLKILKDHQKFSVWFDARYAALFLTHIFAIHFSPPILMFFVTTTKYSFIKFTIKLTNTLLGGSYLVSKKVEFCKSWILVSCLKTKKHNFKLVTIFDQRMRKNETCVREKKDSFPEVKKSSLPWFQLGGRNGVALRKRDVSKCKFHYFIMCKRCSEY